jgi:hypothetical protein
LLLLSALLSAADDGLWLEVKGFAVPDDGCFGVFILIDGHFLFLIEALGSDLTDVMEPAALELRTSHAN